MTDALDAMRLRVLPGDLATRGAWVYVCVEAETLSGFVACVVASRGASSLQECDAVFLQMARVSGELHGERSAER